MTLCPPQQVGWTQQSQAGPVVRKRETSVLWGRAVARDPPGSGSSRASTPHSRSQTRRLGQPVPSSQRTRCAPRPKLCVLLPLSGAASQRGVLLAQATDGSSDGHVAVSLRFQDLKIWGLEAYRLSIAE